MDKNQHFEDKHIEVVFKFADTYQIFAEFLFKANGEIDESASVSHQCNLFQYIYGSRPDLSRYEVIELDRNGDKVVLYNSS